MRYGKREKPGHPEYCVFRQLNSEKPSFYCALDMNIDCVDRMSFPENCPLPVNIEKVEAV